MRIAFVGKGGSGKTTVASLFARYLASIGKKVTAIDADINQHLGEALGLNKDDLYKVPSLSDLTPQIFEFVRGANACIPSPTHLRMTTPPGIGSRKITLDETILPKAKKDKNLSVVRTGDFETEDVGMVCYHGKSSITEIVLNHLADKDDEYVVVDMTAGADAFSTGMFLKFDVICIIVEPTLKSFGVYEQYLKYREGHNINIVAVGNKVSGAEGLKFLENKIGSDLIGCINSSNFVLRSEMGENPEFKELEPENVGTLTKILKYLDKHKQPRKDLYNGLVSLHKKHAKSWLNDRFNFDFASQIHENFDPNSFYG